MNAGLPMLYPALPEITLALGAMVLLMLGAYGGAKSTPAITTASFLLLVAAAPTRRAQLAYFVSFAAGTMIGMLGVSFSLAAIVRLASGRAARWATVLHLGSAVTSVAVGFALAATTVAGL